MAKKRSISKVNKKSYNHSTFWESWEVIKNNKVLFLPNFITLLINLILFYGVLYFSGLQAVIINNDFLNFEEVLLSSKALILFLIYVLLSLLIDNFFLTVKYGLIKDVLLKKKASFREGLSFGYKHYWTTLGIHILSYLIIIIPLLLMGIIFFLILPLQTLLAVTLFFPILIIYLVYITIRLLFVFPVMAFEKEGAYKSLQDDFHYVKTHLHHTFMTWLLVIIVFIIFSIIKENLGYVNEFFYNQLFVLGLLIAGILILLEMAVSVWEHVFIFKSYLSGKAERKEEQKKKGIIKEKVQKKGTKKQKTFKRPLP